MIAEIATVIVTYNPDLGFVLNQQEALTSQVCRIVVDNAYDNRISDQLNAKCIEIGCQCISNEKNVGLAAALNQGVLLAKENGCRYVLLLDQDTDIGYTQVQQLRQTYDSLFVENKQLGAIGPALVDVETGTKHGFHKVKHGLWSRIYPTTEMPLICDGLNGSGMFINVDKYLGIGGMDENLFIDHVDTEFSFRLIASGARLYGVPSISIVHRMGIGMRRVWLLGWRPWPTRSALRHYYLFRNTVWLIKRSEVPFVWKFWAVFRIPFAILMTMIAGPSRWAQMVSMCKGLMHGVFTPSARRGVHQH